MQARTLRVEPDSAQKKPLADLVKLALRPPAQSLVGLALLVSLHGNRGVISHVVVGHLPKNDRPRLKLSRRVKEHFQPGPIGGLKGVARLNPKKVGHHRPESAEGGDEPHLTELRARVVVELCKLETGGTLFLKQVMLRGRLQDAKRQKTEQHCG